MNEERHSHKKAAGAAFVVFLLLAYVGSYLWLRKHPLLKFDKAHFVIMPFRPNSVGAAKFGNELYGPLMNLDLRFTGKSVVFTTRGWPEEP